MGGCFMTVRRCLLFATFLTLGILLLIFGILVLHPIYINICEASHAGAPQKCEPNNVLYIAFLEIGRRISHAEFWTALATIFIAVFTLTLKRSTDKLWETNKEQIHLARDEFISSHRPRLIVRQFVLLTPRPDQPLKITFAVINVGDTEAIFKFIAAEAALLNGRYWEAPGIDFIVKPVSERPIKNGQRVSMTIQSRFNITADQIKAVEQAALIICAVGELTYIDCLGTERRTGFRRNYDVSTDIFGISPNQDQEYQD